MSCCENRPNILLILTDQHRLSALGCYGDTPCQTPHLDRLARMGVHFQSAYTSCTVRYHARVARPSPVPYSIVKVRKTG